MTQDIFKHKFLSLDAKTDSTVTQKSSFLVFSTQLPCQVFSISIFGLEISNRQFAFFVLLCRIDDIIVHKGFSHMKGASKTFLIFLFIILTFFGYLFFSIPDLLHRNRVIEVRFNDYQGDVLFTRSLQVEGWSIASNPYLVDAFVKSRDIECRNANFHDLTLAQMLVDLYPKNEGFLDYIGSKLLLYKLHLFYTSEELIELYLKNVYFGHSIWGMKNASKFYFGKDLENLLVEEVAFLVARLNSQEIKNAPSFLTNLGEILTVMDSDVSGRVRYIVENENLFFSYVYKLLGRRLKIVNTTVNVYTSFDPILDSNIMKMLKKDLLSGSATDLEFIVFSKDNKVRSIYLMGDIDKEKEYIGRLIFLESIVDEFNEIIYSADYTGSEVLDHNFRVGDNLIFCRISPKAAMDLWEKFIISLSEKVEVKHSGGRNIFDAMNFTEKKSTIKEEGKYNIKGIIWRSQNGR